MSPSRAPGQGQGPSGAAAGSGSAVGLPVVHRSPHSAENPDTATAEPHAPAALSVDGLSGVWTNGGGGPTAKVSGHLVPQLLLV